MIILSVDTKKKELIGNFANRGAVWCKHPIRVNDHDFRSLGKGIAIPMEFTIYSIMRPWFILEIPVTHQSLPSIVSHTGLTFRDVSDTRMQPALYF